MVQLKRMALCLAISFLWRCERPSDPDLSAFSSPIIFQGNDRTAYRDPAVFFDRDTFYLFFTLVEIEPSDSIYSYTAFSKSKNLRDWSLPKKITPKDQRLNYCSPGNIVRYGEDFILCLQTYPRPGYTVAQAPRYGDHTARIYTMKSKDLIDWEAPELIKVKGPGVEQDSMGRMIDPYLVEDKNEPGKWWCFYKQNGASMSFSYDLQKWTYFGNTQSGENVCVLIENDEYLMLHSPQNGMGIKRSADLETWKDWGEPIVLGQQNWDWAKGRISAGAVLDLRRVKAIGKYLLFFHGSGPKTEREGDFDKNASLGIAWSDDLINWDWPGKE